MQDEIEARQEQRSVPQAGLFGRLVEKGGSIFAAALILAMSALVVEVVLRYVFNSPTSWVHETTVFLVAMTFAYGGLYCAARDNHIRVVILYDVLGKKTRRYFDILISLVCAAAAFTFGWAAWTMASKAVFRPDGTVRLETTGSAWDPAFPAYLKIFLFIVLIASGVQFLVLAFNYLRNVGEAE